MKKKQSLREEISSFQHNRKFLALPLVIVGALGLLLPVVPGVVLVLLGIALISPGRAEDVRRKVEAAFEK